MFNWIKEIANKEKIKSHWKWGVLASVLVIVTLLASQLSVIDQQELAPGQVGIGLPGDKVITLGDPAMAAGLVDYTFDGVADDVQFQAALNALPATGGRLVVVSSTTINFANTVSRAIDDVVIQGSGAGTYFANDGGTAIFDAGVQAGWIFRDFSTDAGGLDVATATQYRIENVTLGTVYYPGSTKTATYVVAASDAPAHVKSQADYLCDGTADEVQIQAAIDALPSGVGTVQLSQGTFTIGATINPSTDLALIGADGNTTITTPSFYPLTYTANGNYLYLKGIKFVNTHATDYSFVTTTASYGVTRVLVENCEFDNVRLYLEAGSDIHIWNNYFHDLVHSSTPQNACPIQVSDASTNVNIHDNYINACEGAGIIVNTGSAAVNIHDNILIATGSNAGYGIDTHDSVGVTIDGNVLIDCKSGILSENSAGQVIINGNYIEGLNTSGGVGIRVWRDGVGESQATMVVVSDNVCYTFSQGIQIFDELQTIIADNTVQNINNNGIRVDMTSGWSNPRSIKIHGNDIFNFAQTTYQNGILVDYIDYVDIYNNNIDGDSNANSRGIQFSNVTTAPNSSIVNNRIQNCTYPLVSVPADVLVRDNPGNETHGDKRTISCIIDHASLSDNGDATADIDFAEQIPAYSVVKSVYCDFTEAFNSDDTTTLTMMIGYVGDLDAFNKTADPGENAFNHTTDVGWAEEACQAPEVTAAKTVRVTFTEDDDGTDIISSANAQGKVNIYITYLKY